MKNIYVLSLSFFCALLAQPLSAAQECKEREERPERIDLGYLLELAQADDYAKSVVAQNRKPVNTPEEREAFMLHLEEGGAEETVDQKNTREREIEIVKPNRTKTMVYIYKSASGDFYLPTMTGENSPYVRFVKPEGKAWRSMNGTWRIAFNPKSKIFGFRSY